MEFTLNVRAIISTVQTESWSFDPFWAICSCSLHKSTLSNSKQIICLYKKLHIYVAVSYPIERRVLWQNRPNWGRLRANIAKLPHTTLCQYSHWRHRSFGTEAQALRFFLELDHNIREESIWGAHIFSTILYIHATTDWSARRCVDI